MRPYQPDRQSSLAERAVGLCLIISMALFSVPGALAQQKQDDKDKQQTTQKPDTKQQTAKKTDTPSRRRPRRKVGLLESYKLTIDVGIRTFDLSGEHPGKFEEYRDFTKGVTIRNLFLNFETPNSPYILNFKGLEMGERDQRFSAEAWKIGKFRTKVLWDEIPKYYDKGRTFSLNNAQGLLAVNPDMRARLQAAPNSGAGASTLGNALPNQVRQELPFEATEQLRVRTEQFLFTQSYRPSKFWELFVRGQNVRMSGIRPRPTGTFASENTGPAGDPVWEALGVELPEPVTYRTTNLTFGTLYARGRWKLGLNYDLSFFRNATPSLTWENPFRVTDQLANAPAFGVGRNRFVLGQLALPPDNDYHNVTARGSVQLPYKTELRGTVVWGRGSQNEPFLPYTLNSAMVAANLLPGQPALFGLALPQPSLNGKVHTLSQDYALASKPRRDMNFLLQYRFYNRSNLSPSITFPGLPAFGDSGVRTSIDFFNLPLENLPTSYTRQNALADWQWDVSRKFNLELGYEWEIWNRKLRDAPRTNEHMLRGRLNYKPITGLLLKADYLYANRTPRLYLTQPLSFNPNINTGTAAAPINAGPGWEVTPATRFIRGVSLEFNQLRRFDESKRIRNNGGLSLDVSKWEKVDFSASFRYLRDDYDKDFYGLLYNTQATTDVQVNYYPQQRTSFYANYSREFNQYGYRDLGHRIIIAARNVTACCPQFPIANTYDRASRINFDMFQFGFKTKTKDESTTLDIFYGLGFAKDRTTAGNPFPILAVSLRTAGAYNYPDVISRQQEANVTLMRRIRAGLYAGVRYRYEPYRLDDYYTNNLQPYQAAISEQPGVSVPVARYLFLDSKFTTSHINTVTFFLRYSF